MRRNNKKLLQRLKAKVSHTTEGMSRLAWKRYEEIKAELEARHFGKYVMLEVDSGDYFIGDTDWEAYQKARQAHPEKIFHLIRIGYKAAHTLKGRS